MILRSIHLRPFAGLSDRRVDFQDGLNVVVGANEVGKSTILRAVKSALFTSVLLSPARFKKEMSLFLPVTGGDTIRVSLSIDAAGERCLIEKTWGGTQHCRLKLSTGGEFTDPSVVDGKVKELLALNEGTFGRVLITQQSELAGTLRSLLADGDVLNSFSDLLRKMIVETGGMSAGRMLETVRMREQACFERWDQATGGPEGNRGLDRPWLKGVGSILKAHYELKMCERNLKQAVEYEAKIDELVKQANLLEHRIRDLQTYCDCNSSIAKDVQQRVVLELRKESLSKEGCEMKETANLWPRYEERVDRLSGPITKARSQLLALREEGAAAEQFEKQKALRANYEEARTKRQQLIDEEQKLSAMPAVTEADVREIRGFLDEQKRIDVQIKAQQLSLNLRAVAPLRAEISTALGERKTVSLESGQSLEDSVGGQFVLSHKDWSLTVIAGSGEVSSLIERRKSLEQKATRGLDRFGVSGLEEFVQLHAAHRQQLQIVSNRRVALDAVTRGKTFEEIEAAVQSLPQVNPARAMQEIRSEIERVTEEGTQMKSEMQEAARYIEGYVRRYGNQDSLEDARLRKLSDEKDIDKEMVRLQSLPDGYDDARTFLAEFEARTNDLATQINALHSIQIERKDVERGAPEESQIDLTARVKEAKGSFARAVQTGKAYRRVRQELESILARSDEKAFVPFQGRIEKTLHDLTTGRYTKIVTDRALPRQIAGDGAALPVELLSSGTLDVLALAVRLSMAEYYLGPRDGFVVMDDPLVNLDPVRQAAAAKCIQEFAERHQVIVLTCHPAHGDVLAGRHIDL
jgi:DNA repair protein SbcC/Rad50